MKVKTPSQRHKKRENIRKNALLQNEIIEHNEMITPNENHGGKADDEHNDPLKQVQIIKEMTEQVRDSLAVIDLHCEIIFARLTNDDDHLIKCLKNAYAQYNAAVKHNAGLE